MRPWSALFVAIILLMTPATAMLDTAIDPLAPSASSDPSAASTDIVVQEVDSRGRAMEAPGEDAAIATPQSGPVAQQAPVPEDWDVTGRDLLGNLEALTGIAPDSPEAPEALRSLQHVLMMQQPNGTNGTNGTILDMDHNGTETHHHGNVKDQGLSPVWAAPFHGIGRGAVLSDLDGDGDQDAVVASDLAITAVRSDGSLLWARHLGSTVTAIRIVDLDADGAPEVAYSTLWGAQNPRVGLLAANGAILWEYEGQTSFLRVDETGDGDLIASDIQGVHHRLSGETGVVVWKTAVELLPSTGAIFAGYYNLGHYLAEAGDLNGDGITDSVSVGLNYYYAFVPLGVSSWNWFSMVHAVDGATGDVLWRHNVGGDPNPDGFSQVLVTAIEGLDLEGDETHDIAYGVLGFRWYTPLLLAGIWYESGVRAVQGDGTALATPLGARELWSPLLPLEVYYDLDHIDTNGDGKQELVAAKVDIVQALLNGISAVVDRYAMLPSATEAPAMLVLSDVSIAFNDTVLLRGVDVDGERLVLALTGDHQSGYVTAMAADGSVPWIAVTASGRATATAFDGERLVIVTPAEVSFLDGASHEKLSSFPMRGAPRDFGSADFDLDGYLDVYVRASDGNIHILDGLTGRVLHTLDLVYPIEDFRLVDIDEDGPKDLVLMRPGPDYDRYVEGWNGTGEKRIWSHMTFTDPFRGIDITGDGVEDLLTDWYAFRGEYQIRDGRTGKTVGEGTFAYPSGFTPWSWGQFTSMRAQDGKDLFVIMDDFDGIAAFDVEDGSLEWHLDLDIWDIECFAVADINGDHVDELFLVVYDGDVRTVKVNAGGGSSGVKMVYGDYLYRCAMQAVPRATGGEDLLVHAAYFTQDRDPRGGIGRFNGTHFLWERFSKNGFDDAYATTLFGVKGTVDGGRLYYATQDHAYAHRWSDGTRIGEFTANGPFFTRGLVADLDGSEPSEAIALTGDGMVWALSEDAANVQENLREAAVELGKEAPATLDAGDDKKSPGVGLVLGILLVAMLALRRRAQHK